MTPDDGLSNILISSTPVAGEATLCSRVSIVERRTARDRRKTCEIQAGLSLFSIHKAAPTSGCCHRTATDNAGLSRAPAADGGCKRRSPLMAAGSRMRPTKAADTTWREPTGVSISRRTVSGTPKGNILVYNGADPGDQLGNPDPTAPAQRRTNPPSRINALAHKRARRAHEI